MFGNEYPVAVSLFTCFYGHSCVKMYNLHSGSAIRCSSFTIFAALTVDVKGATPEASCAALVPGKICDFELYFAMCFFSCWAVAFSLWPFLRAHVIETVHTLAFC